MLLIHDIDHRVESVVFEHTKSNELLLGEQWGDIGFLYGYESGIFH